MSLHYTSDGVFVNVKGREVFLDGHDILTVWLRDHANSALVETAWTQLRAAGDRLERGSIIGVIDAAQDVIDLCEAV